MSIDGQAFEPLDLLSRSHDTNQLLRFIQALDEEMTAATANAVRAFPLTTSSAKQARGAARRHFMENAIRSAGLRTGIQVDTEWSKPATWSYPTVKMGAFKVAVGIIFSRNRNAPRQLRTKSAYAKALCARNSPLSPQGQLFPDPSEAVKTVIPEGAFGGFIVSEHSSYTDEVPSFLGLWIPSNDLKQRYHSYSLEEIMLYLRAKLAKQTKPTRKNPSRKFPTLKQKPSPKKK
ncbi:hypothetical protein HUE56_11760 [Azospirillum oryzae]|uniref:Uncharacterized protein n=1 Tax=Azospirillum oryzae TaxID=286727 RepID=A0A6N1AHU5_9PROT|nr:hypothetical protein [Azospirillum oryzae]KAA0589335.1 hypothetical protein FZ938_06775 [Azospirillum oryzae]QKS51176.1 hypothetical protein HUE56_11760 [Azospirillum oryzae]GLR79724.1 hypothetical protein GCM10007856_23990 [Azospirillum oryzae]